MNRKPILALLSVAALSLFAVASAHATEAPPPAPTEQAPAPTAPTPSAPVAVKPAARREDTEPKTLTDALKALKLTRDDRDSAEGKIEAEELAHGKTKDLLRSALDTCKVTQKERDELRDQLATVTKERDEEKSTHTKTKSHLDLLEGLCNVRGIDSKKAVPAVASPGEGSQDGAALYQQYENLRQSDTAKAQSFYREHKAALDAYADAQRP